MQELHTDNLEAACNGSKSYEKEIDDGKGQQKLVEAITSMDVDFAQWYTDVVKKAELIDYSSGKGMYDHQVRQAMRSGRISRKSLTADSKRPA